MKISLTIWASDPLEEVLIASMSMEITNPEIVVGRHLRSSG
jgi:hypothetical protein